MVRITGTTRDIYKIKLADNSSTKINSSSFTASTVGAYASNNRFYFSATDATYGAELYEIDLATDAVTRRSDINPAAATAFPANFVQVGSKLYFSAVVGTGATLDRELYSFDLPGTVVPVSGLGFTAQKQAGHVLLNWQTATEQNSRSFNIQHSEQGVAFKTVGAVQAAGNSSNTQRYQFTHQQPAKGYNYYRLEQTDIDGRSSYSAVAKVFFENTGFSLLTSPVGNKQVQVYSSNKQVLSLLTSDGRRMMKINLTEGVNTINVAHLPAGIYLLRTANNSEKLILQ